MVRENNNEPGSVKAGNNGRCPYCARHVQFVRAQSASGWWNEQIEVVSTKEAFALQMSICPACVRIVLSLVPIAPTPTGARIIWPEPCGSPVPDCVPKHVAQDFIEASLVLRYSPKASAALSRRCLQNVLREAAGVTPMDLSKEIEQVLGSLPSHIRDDVDAIRQIGNFAAHPNKDRHTGVIIDVEPHEAEWLLQILVELFDFYYVKPKEAERRRAELVQKRSAAMKTPAK